MQFDINDPQLAKTKVGIVEYVDIGSGPVVVSLHGAMGGYDQIFTRRVLVRSKVGEFMQGHFSA